MIPEKEKEIFFVEPEMTTHVPPTLQQHMLKMPLFLFSTQIQVKLWVQQLVIMLQPPQELTV